MSKIEKGLSQPMPKIDSVISSINGPMSSVNARLIVEVIGVGGERLFHANYPARTTEAHLDGLYQRVKKSYKITPWNELIPRS